MRAHLGRPSRARGGRAVTAMPSFAKTIGLCLLCAAVCVVAPLPAAHAQISLAAPTTTTTSTTHSDPLGRTSPSNAVLGFLKAAQAGDYSIAAQYLQMSPARRQSEGEQTASKLKFVLDHAFTGNL